MKRFLETSDWNKPWFQDLSAIEKCLWRYINDNCDCAGIWDPNWKQASFQIGSKVTEETAQVFAGRLQKLPDGSLRIIGFITLQYGKLSRECKPHTPVFAALEARGLTFEELSERVTIPIECPSEGKNYLQEKEKDKDKDKEKEEGESEGKPKPQLSEDAETLRLRIFSWFNRRPTTFLDPGELTVFKRCVPQTDPSDLLILEEYYRGPCRWKRSDLKTLLNNWNGEIDRAKKWKSGDLFDGHNQINRPNPAQVDRNAGTANAGKASQYRLPPPV